MDPTDITIAMLKDIRAGIERTNDRLDGTNDRLDCTNERLDRVVHEQIRHSTAIVALEQGFAALEEGFVGVTRGLVGVQGQIVHLTDEVRRFGSRLDNVLIGPMGQQVRDHEERIRRLEGVPSP